MHTSKYIRYIRVVMNFTQIDGFVHMMYSYGTMVTHMSV